MSLCLILGVLYSKLLALWRSFWKWTRSVHVHICSITASIFRVYSLFYLSLNYAHTALLFSSFFPLFPHKRNQHCCYFCIKIYSFRFSCTLLTLSCVSFAVLGLCWLHIGLEMVLAGCLNVGVGPVSLAVWRDPSHWDKLKVMTLPSEVEWRECFLVLPVAQRSQVKLK